MISIGHPWLLAIPLTIVVASSLLVALDAGRRGQSRVLWFLVSMLTFPLGGVAWLVVRAVGVGRPTPRAPSPTSPPPPVV